MEPYLSEAGLQEMKEQNPWMNLLMRSVKKSVQKRSAKNCRRKKKRDKMLCF